MVCRSVRQNMPAAGGGHERRVSGDGERSWPGPGRTARLDRLEFQGLAAVPLQAEWFANIDNPRTGRA